MNEVYLQHLFSVQCISALPVSKKEGHAEPASPGLSLCFDAEEDVKVVFLGARPSIEE